MRSKRGHDVLIAADEDFGIFHQVCGLRSDFLDFEVLLDAGGSELIVLLDDKEELLIERELVEGFRFFGVAREFRPNSLAHLVDNRDANVAQIADSQYAFGGGGFIKA